MNLKKALAEIERLTKQNQALLEEQERNHRLIFELNAQLNEVLKQKEAIKEKHTIERLRRFVPKTEVGKAVIINEAESILKETKIRKPKSEHFSTFDFERHVTETRYEEPSETTCTTCKEDLVLASQKVRYVIESIPATLKVVKIIKKSCKCERCNKTDNKLYYPISNTLFPGSIVSHSFLSYVGYHKYELGIPFEHLSRHIKDTLEIEISKQNLANYMAKMSNVLTPLYDRMRSDLLSNQAGVIHADETTLSISKRPDEDKERKKSYVYVYTSSFYDEQISIYDFHESRSIDRTAAWLKDYKGTIVCDDYAGYTKLKKDNPNIKLQRCFAHVRRRFMDIIKSVPEADMKDSYAAIIIEVIGRLFHLEAEYKRQKLTPREILKARNKTHPVIHKELEALVFNTPYKPNSAIEGAINYTKKVWSELFTYMETGYVEISNNIAERAVKPFVLNRKVFMNSGSYAGARYTTQIFSIIRTARINDINVSAYLEYVLDHIQSSPIETLLPYHPDILKRFKNT
jgi:hypothetical protein